LEYSLAVFDYLRVTTIVTPARLALLEKKAENKFTMRQCV
jgi:hypothetical protein